MYYCPFGRFTVRRGARWTLIATMGGCDELFLRYVRLEGRFALPYAITTVLDGKDVVDVIALVVGRLLGVAVAKSR